MTSEKKNRFGSLGRHRDYDGRFSERHFGCSHHHFQRENSEYFFSKDFTPSNRVESIDARGCLVMPGLINGHTHVGMTLLRGIADDLPLHDWLRKHIFLWKES